MSNNSVDESFKTVQITINLIFISLMNSQLFPMLRETLTLKNRRRNSCYSNNTINLCFDS